MFKSQMSNRQHAAARHLWHALLHDCDWRTCNAQRTHTHTKAHTILTPLGSCKRECHFCKFPRLAQLVRLLACGRRKETLTSSKFFPTPARIHAPLWQRPLHDGLALRRPQPALVPGGLGQGAAAVKPSGGPSLSPMCPSRRGLHAILI